VPIGRDTNPNFTSFQGAPFSGLLDGRGHVISGLTIDRPDEHHVGLFGQARNSSIKTLGL
jgi:hypothetical protein